ncbi:MAG: hypothetical protein ACLGG4_03900 [Gammaproteobacteria bacterium]
MVATTILRLPELLKVRFVPLAEAVGKSSYTWMIEALEERVAQSEAHAAFMTEALDADRRMTEVGEGYDADEVLAYLTAVLAGEMPEFPKPARR